MVIIVPDKEEVSSKRVAVINTCLEQFVGKGLYGTTSRDLSKALNLQSAGMYSYFENKDDAIVACAEQAAIKLEQQLFAEVFKCLEKDNIDFSSVKELAKQLSPMMRFFTQVCSTDKYEKQMRPILKGLGKRYESHVKDAVKATSLDEDKVRPLVYIGLTAIANYMVYQEESYIDPILKMIENELGKK